VTARWDGAYSAGEPGDGEGLPPRLEGRDAAHHPRVAEQFGEQRAHARMRAAARQLARIVWDAEHAGDVVLVAAGGQDFAAHLALVGAGHVVGEEMRREVCCVTGLKPRGRRSTDGTEEQGDLAPPSTRLFPRKGKVGQGGFAALPSFVSLRTRRTRTQRTAGRGCGRSRTASDTPAVRGESGQHLNEDPHVG